jgi:DNA-binding LacI/PurR family transcriptional regulator
MATVGIKQVAARAGVAVGTVSNVLNQPELVAAPTRDRVLDAIKDLGYVRNESARTLRSGKSRTVALVVLDAANPFFADIASGAEPIVHKLGSMLIICATAGDVKRERQYLAQLEEQRVQGILITSGGGSDDQMLRLSQRGTPIVLVDSKNLRHKTCGVSVDDVHGGRLAVQHLIDTGRHRIALVGGHVGIPQVRERRDGAALAASISRHNIEILTIDTTTLSLAAGRQAGSQIADMPVDERPKGVFCANDLVALGLMRQLAQRGIVVPTEIGVIGYDDIDFAEAAITPLSSLRQPRAEIGRTAAQLLAAELDEGTTHHHRHVIFEPELIVRASTAVPRHRPASRP